jgi:hypothetical protein
MVTRDNDDLDEIILRKGTVIHFGSMPFRIKEDIVVLGLTSNYNLALEIIKELNQSKLLLADNQ